MRKGFYMKKTLCFLCIVLALVLTASSVVGTVAAAQTETEQKIPVSYLPKNADGKLQVYKYDFSNQMMSAYIRNDSLAVSNYASMSVEDETLRNSSQQKMAFGSGVFVGDDYGRSEGCVSFDMQVRSGAVSLGVRVTKAGSLNDGRGIWFSFDGSDKIKVSERDTGASAEIATGVKTNEKVNVCFEEKLSKMVLKLNGETVASATLDEGVLKIFDKNGAEVVSKKGCELYGSGYFSLCFEGGTDGYVDDLEFTNYKVDQSLPAADQRQIDYTTWTASDDLLRVVSSNKEAGDPREDKYVGLFYFLCWVGTGIQVQDITKLYLELGKKDLKAYLQENGGESYWAEPYFGYYRNTDTWVYRKHAYMLEAAGVDFIFLDISNGVTFDKGHLALFDTWLKIREEGGTTPQICFFCGDDSGVFATDIEHLKKTVYSSQNYDKYKELFFMWEGKPLIFGNAAGLSKANKEWLSDFTVRGNWAWCDQDGYWSWLQDYRYDESKDKYSLIDGGLGRDENGKFEELAVSLAHHASTSKGRSYVNRVEPSDKKGDFNFSLEGVGEGKCFEFQFNAASNFDPTVMLITGWNEWIAGCVHNPEHTFFAETPVSGYIYIDQFNPEFSRDAEPMRLRDGVGFGDNYYYQMCDYIRKFKGIDKTTEASGQKSVKLTDISTWDGIGPEYRDTIGDTELRNTISYDAEYRYVNGTGRNDIDYAKVSQDEENLYFLVKCVSDIETDDNENFMNLFINADGDITTGWEGYDYIINRSRDEKTVSVEKFTDGFASEKSGDAEYYIEGQYMTVKLKKSVINASELKNFTFKWADNSTVSGNVMEFMDLGDAAPNDRFAFSYVGYSGENVTYTEDTEADTTDIKSGQADDVSASFIVIVCAVSVAVIAAAAVIMILISRKRGK